MTEVLVLSRGRASARISTDGGSVLGLAVDGIDLLRSAPDDAGAIDSACYPLVPFGNRIRGNSFTFRGETYALAPNTAWDRHYLHGEGWLDEWAVETCEADRLSIRHTHDASRIPYRYTARQRFVLTENGMDFHLSVVNEGATAMPFGIGWHPYFPMTPGTTLETSTGRMWTEEEGWLPGAPVPIPDDLDFRAPRRLPHRWVNNAFEDWAGEAVIRWPEKGKSLRIAADPLFRTMFLFVSDRSFDPGYARDFFALEPMSHLPDGHNLPDLGGLTPLEPGQSFEGAMRLSLGDP
ncbi:MAG: aldose 1-epimerase [Rhizobiaceae bacterium]|nr:aldose 1-epimerase [Rhizobiaceae bacterium]